MKSRQRQQALEVRYIISSRATAMMKLIHSQHHHLCATYETSHPLAVSLSLFLILYSCHIHWIYYEISPTMFFSSFKKNTEFFNVFSLFDTVCLYLFFKFSKQSSKFVIFLFFKPFLHNLSPRIYEYFALIINKDPRCIFETKQVYLIEQLQDHYFYSWAQLNENSASANR